MACILENTELRCDGGTSGQRVKVHNGMQHDSANQYSLASLGLKR